MESLATERHQAAKRLLQWRDTAVIEDAAIVLATGADVGSIAILCEPLATDPDPEVHETILWVLSPLWNSGLLDLPPLLESVAASGTETQREGATAAQRWLGLVD